MPSISFDKIQAQRQRLIQEQNQKAQKAYRKIDHNLNILINSIPLTLLNENVSSLLKRTDGDLNLAIYQQQRQIYLKNQKQIQTPNFQHNKPLEKELNRPLEQSPPKIQNKKRIIKNNKKK